MKKLFLKLIIVSFLFIGASKSANATVDCNIVPPSDQIFVNITSIEITCTGLKPNNRYMAKIMKGTSNNADTESGHCATSDASGNLDISTITARTVAGTDYFAIIADNETPFGKCNTFFSSNEQARVTFEVKGTPTYADTSCNPGDGTTDGITTALGCIPTKLNALVGWILKNAIGMGGGIAFLLIIWGAFQVLTSGGSPEKLNNGKEVIVSAISGLLLIIFSVVILKLIGVDIFQIPGFNP